MAPRIVKQPTVSSDSLVLTPPPLAIATAAKPAAAREATLRQAEAEAAALIAEAQQEAQRLREVAQAEAEALRAAAREEGQQAGYAAGYAEGLAKGREEAERAVQEAAEATVGAYLRQLGALVEQARADRAALVREAEADLVALAIAIAEKVLHQRLANDERSAVLEIAREALERLAAVSAERARVRVHPSDYEAFRDVWDELELQGAGGVPCEVTPDERVEPGGCILEARTARIDGQWSAQIAQVRAALVGETPAAFGDTAGPAAEGAAAP
jgi:flagellar assembly protein FliH